ncbi:MAG: endonuclease/exonuclease/phosphatase family protein [Gloeobacteraceae cyanobacterium ES-bin-316]|nr:endonuclease/exonuclease/phosphatase family protein [Ferruginibacter sp.]
MSIRPLRLIGLVIFGLLAIISFGATLLPFLPFKQWYIRIWDYPRLQTFAIALMAILWYLFFYFKRGRRGYVFVAMFAIVIIVQGYKAWPYTILGHKQVLQSERSPSDTTTVSLLICNVLQTNTSYQKVLELVKEQDPDIFITTESDSIWQHNLKSIEDNFPFRVAIPQSNTYGMHLYSKLALDSTQVRYLLEKDIPSIKTKVQLKSREWITLFVLHPRPPVPTEASDSRERDAEIIMVAKETRKHKEGVMVAGDFNDVAWSKTTELFQEVTGFLDPRRGRGFYNTFHANIPFFRWPLDHIFHSSHFKLVHMHRAKKVDSDHFPMYIKLSCEPGEKHEQPKVKPDSDTEADANKTIKKGINDGDAPGK